MCDSIVPPRFRMMCDSIVPPRFRMTLATAVVWQRAVTQVTSINSAVVRFSDWNCSANAPWSPLLWFLPPVRVLCLQLR
jgi:hypothetical protein